MIGISQNKFVIIFLSFVQVCWSEKPPNIIFILADDLGWHDVSFHGSEISTPNIDKLAYGGVILDNYYVQPICTPTRSAIMTGRYPIHTGLQHYVIQGAQPYGMPLEDKILPQHLKDLGYSTHIVGKWHLGFFKKDYLPENRGFDSHFGYYLGREDYFDHYASDYYFGYDLHRNGETVWNKSEVYSTEMYTEEAERIIKKHNQSKPLFLYLAHQAVHAGDRPDTIQAPQKYIDRHPHIKDLDRRMFAGVVSALDDSVGAVYKSLQDAGMADNTIIVFSTDNGGPTDGYDGNAACNWPLRGNKNTLWEGGVRGVGFIHSPLIKSPGRVSDGLMHVVDWLPTLVQAAKGQGVRSVHQFDNGSNDGNKFNSSERVASNLNGERLANTVSDIDGIALWDRLLDFPPSNSSDWPRHEVLLNIDPISNFSGIIVGDYKLLHGRIPFPNWYPPPGIHTSDFNIDVKKYQLADIGSHQQSLDAESLLFDKEFDIFSSISDLRNKPISSKSSAVTNHGGRPDEDSNSNFENSYFAMSNSWVKPSLSFKKQTFDSKSDKLTSTDHELSTEDDIKQIAEEFNKRNEPIVIKCGKIPPSAYTNCNPLKRPCLFNVKDDPCEFINLADTLPDTVATLENRLKQFKKTMVEPRNKPEDSRGNPQNNGGDWKPWL